MKELIKTIHQELAERLEKYQYMVCREVEFIELKDKISVTIGMRRTGKTYLMYHKLISFLLNQFL